MPLIWRPKSIRSRLGRLLVIASVPVPSLCGFLSQLWLFDAHLPHTRAILITVNLNNSGKLGKEDAESAQSFIYFIVQRPAIDLNY